MSKLAHASGDARLAAAGGTMTFLFTDIEGSTRLWETQGTAMQAALARHDEVLQRAIADNRGRLVKTTGDGAYAAFGDAADALAATLVAQRALHGFGEGLRIRSRMALHTGIAEQRDDDYLGPTLNRAARLMAAAHGGQILVSQETARLVGDRLPDHVALRDMGERRLKDLVRSEHVYQVVAEGLPAEFPALRTLDARPNNLPAQATPLVGRDGHLAALRTLLRAPGTRLVTLSGVGGSGKTRLALQAAADMVDEFEHGVFLVPLAAVHDPALVVASVAHALGLQESGERPIGVLVDEHLRSRELLLVLDNFEHVIDAAPGIAGLLAAAPRLKVIVTSREVLKLSAEAEHAVGPLSMPDARSGHSVDALMRYEAVALFVARAVAVKPRFALTQSNAAAIVGICRRLDGLPLAIELAAARVRALPVAAILQALDRRMDFLRDGARDLPARQRTLRSAIDWSHDLLDEGERTLFRRLAVMAGGASLEAIVAVCDLEGADVLATLESLVAKSLVRSVDSDAEPRFSMLETVREYAQERLAAAGEATALRDRHVSHFLALAEDAQRELTGAAQAEWLARLERDHDNLRAALEWSLRDGCSEPALRLCGALQRFWFTRGHLSEGRAWCARALTGRTHTSRTAALANAINTDAVLAYLQADYAAARTLLEECLVLRRELNDLPGIAESLNDLGSVFQYQGQHALARPLLEEALAMRRQIGDARGAAASLNNLGNLAFAEDDIAAAKAIFEQCLAILRDLGDRRSAGIVLMNLGGACEQQGDLAAARAMIGESIEIMRELDDPWGTASALDGLARVAVAQGDLEGAHALHREALSLANEIGDLLVVALSLEALAAAAARRGAPLRAACMWGAVEKLRETIGSAKSNREHARHEHDVEAARAACGEVEAFQRAWQEGRAGLQQVIEDER